MSSQSSQNGGKSIRTVARPAVQIETEVKSGNWNEFVKIFAPITSVMMALTVAYGASPDDLPIPGGKQFFEQHMKMLLGQGGEMKGLPSPEELEKMIEGAAQLGASQAADRKNLPAAQKLTQENLAKLVKETAIKNGVVLPNGMRRASTALPQAPTKTLVAPTATVRPKAKSVSNVRTAPRKQAPTAKATPGPIAKAKPSPAKATPAVKPKATPATGPMREVMTASGVMIKIPKAEVEEAKRSGTITTKSGLKIKIGKDEIEEAQKKKGTTIMTSSGVPIKISPSGAITLPEKASVPPASGAKKPAATAGKGVPKITPSSATAKKIPASNGAVKKPASAPPKKLVSSAAVRK